ncbi:hypothetical protein [Pantoea sp. B65]|uniref:hypothetical protein n=1 Tax=Pantoea sp. B65 TaxID=2813359 RepID=UPI0039B656FB
MTMGADDHDVQVLIIFADCGKNIIRWKALFCDIGHIWLRAVTGAIASILSHKNNDYASGYRR